MMVGISDTMSCAFGLEETEEEYLEDLILLNYEQRNIYHVNPEAECYNLNGAWRLTSDIIFNPTLRRHCTSPDISDRVIPQKDSTLIVKLIDFVKFPWYFKRYMHQIINKMKILQAITITESDSEDDCIILEDPARIISIKIKTKSDSPVMKALEEPLTTQLEKNPLNMKRLESIKRKNDSDIQKALSKKNKNDMDFKRNKGLIGLTITPKVNVNDVAPDATHVKPKEVCEKTEQKAKQINPGTIYLIAADKILNSCGTDLIAVIEDSDKSAITQNKRINEIAKNVVSENDKQTVTDSSDRSLNMRVKCAVDKKTHKDISQNKLGSPIEKEDRKVDKLKKPKKPKSVDEKHSRLKVETPKKFEKNVKDSKLTNRYSNDLKKRKIDTTNQCFDTQQKLAQTMPNLNVQQPASKDIAKTKKNSKELSNTADNKCTGSRSLLILQSNPLPKLHKGTHEKTLNLTNPNISQNASNRTSNESEKYNNKSYTKPNVTKPNILKATKSANKKKMTSDKAVSNSYDDNSINKTGQNSIVATLDQTKRLNKLHYYSLSYPETKNKTLIGTKKKCDEQIKHINNNPTISDTQNISGPRVLSNNNLEECPIQILSVERINNYKSLNKTQIPSINDIIHRSPLRTPTSCDIFQYPAGTLNKPSQKDSNLTQQPLPAIRNINSVQVPNHKPNVNLRPKMQNNPRFAQPIQTHVSSRSMFPPYRGAPFHRPITPQRYSNTSFMYRHPLPPKVFYGNSLGCHHTSFQGPTEPVIPSVTVQSSQDIHPRPINANSNLRNVPKNMLGDRNYVTMPSIYRNHSLPQVTCSQPLLSPYPPYHSSHHSSHQTHIQPNPMQNERCLLTLDNNNIKKNDLTTALQPNVDNGGQVTKEGKTTSVNMFKVPVSIVLETLETVDTKTKMLEELDKIIIYEDFDEHLERVEDEEVLNSTQKNDPQSKQVKTVNQQVTTNKANEIQLATTNKISYLRLPTKGYSPPILPIPGTLEEIMEKVKPKPQHNVKKDSRHLTTYIQPNTSAEKAKKISMDEYKKRTSKTNTSDGSPNKKVRRDKCEHRERSRAKNHRIHSVDSDHGYDSDSTMII